jgi:hypothetical protein
MSNLYEALVTSMGGLSTSQSVFPLYASDRTSGIVLDIGDSACVAVPIYEGAPIAKAIQRLDIGGRELTDWLMKIMKEERGYNFARREDRDIVRVLVEVVFLLFLLVNFLAKCCVSYRRNWHMWRLTLSKRCREQLLLIPWTNPVSFWTAKSSL